MKPNRSPFPFPLLRFWAVRILPAWLFIGLVVFLFQINTCAMVHDDEKITVILKLIDMLPASRIRMTLFSPPTTGRIESRKSILRPS